MLYFFHPDFHKVTKYSSIQTHVIVNILYTRHSEGSLHIYFNFSKFPNTILRIGHSNIREKNNTQPRSRRKARAKFSESSFCIIQTVYTAQPPLGSLCVVTRAVCQKSAKTSPLPSSTSSFDDSPARRVSSKQKSGEIKGGSQQTRARVNGANKRGL